MAARAAKAKAEETPVGTLKRVFKYDSFLDCQQQAIEQAEAGKNVLAVVRTGGGKSIIFQIPGIRRSGLTIVISPLISLMHDQVNDLVKRKVAAVVIDGDVSQAKRKEIWQQIRAKKIRFLYVSPEQLSTETFYKELKDTTVSLLVVDEAHCIAQWGHDFRREYLDIPKFRKRLGMPQIIAVTATAPVHIRNEILENLCIQDAVQIIGDLDRPNLIVSVTGYDSNYEKLAWLSPHLRENSQNGTKTLVYCRRVRTVEELATEFAARKNIRFGVYHGQLEGEERKSADQKFRSGLTPILFATKAVGMGWNIPDIREVIHFDPPESLDELWQEMGRSGRDGHRAYCYTMFQRHDIQQLFRFIRSAHPTMDQLETLWRRLCNCIRRDGWAAKYPEGFFLEEKFIAEYEDSYGQGSGSVARTCIARFCEYGMIRIHANKIVFLIKPDYVNKHGFPFTEQELGTKREAAILQLKVMLQFLATAGENPRRMIMEYFHLNTLVDHVKELDLETWYVPKQDCLKTILLSVAERDLQRQDLQAYLRGAGAVAGPYCGTLKNLTAREVNLDISQAENLHYLRAFALDDRTFLTLTPKGVTHLKELGFGLEPDVLYTKLKRRMHNPANKVVLKEAIEDWWRCVKGRHTPNEWWRIIEEFLETTFEVLDRSARTKLTGMEIVADFCHKKPVMKRAKLRFNEEGERNGKAGAGLRLTDAKLFLNYLFANAIET